MSLSSGGCPIRKRSDSSKGDGCKITSHSGPGLFAGATGEHPSHIGDVAKKCPIHKSHHTLQECQMFEGMSTSEKEQVVGEHNLCLSCVSQCRTLVEADAQLKTVGRATILSSMRLT